MQTLHPEACIKLNLLYEIRSKSVQLYRCEKRKREVLIIDRFFGGFLAYVLIFELFQTLQTKKQRGL